MNAFLVRAFFHFDPTGRKVVESETHRAALDAFLISEMPGRAGTAKIIDSRSNGKGPVHHFKSDTGYRFEVSKVA